MLRKEAKNCTMKKTFFSFLLLGLAFSVSAQDFSRDAIVNKLADLMNRNYVFPEKGKEMHDLIIGRLKSGEYESLSSETAFASELESDLRSVINDKHIRVSFNPERVEAILDRDFGEDGAAKRNYGFEEVKILEDRIGYLDLRGFMDISLAEESAKSAMDKLITADAIIFDLRKNGGGSPSMIRFISSYLFGDEPVHLNTFYWRPANNYSETWTEPGLASQTKPDIPIYVLTSDYTFSAAEEFTYNLKNLERATIVGETTGGGAHPGGPMVITDGFLVNVPQGRAINPVTNTNWEGVGVEPHIKVPKEQALETALELARKALARD